MLSGIILARFGLWIFDLAVQQRVQETVAEESRGAVGGVMNAMNSVMDMLHYILVIVAPRPEHFSILTFNLCGDGEPCSYAVCPCTSAALSGTPLPFSPAGRYVRVVWWFQRSKVSLQRVTIVVVNEDVLVGTPEPMLRCLCILSSHSLPFI